MTTKKHSPKRASDSPTNTNAAAAPALKLVQSVSRETVNVLEQLLEGARAGEVVGLCVAVMLKRHRYFVDAVGESRRNVVEARGHVCALADELRRLVQEQADTATTLQGFD